MSLKTCVRIAIGFLASSGVAAILSGGALAANNGQDTTSQNVWIQQGSGNQGSGNGNGVQTPAAFQAGSVTQQSEYSSSTQSDNGAVSITNNGDGNVGNTVSGQTGVLESNAGTNSNGTQVPNPSSSKPQKASNSTDTNSNGKQSPVVSGNKLSGNVTAGVSQASTSSNSALAPEVSEVAVVSPDTQVASAPGAKSITRTTILPIQPVITNRVAALAPDLAESMPTAPSPSRIPIPTKSTGVLAGLVVGLSNVVIPQPVVPTDSVSLKLMLGISLLTLVVLLANVFEFSYGQWLRRGGFATAARSDEPSGNLTSPFFATPLLSGYVKQPPRLHNPVSLVVLVPNAYRKEDRR